MDNDNEIKQLVRKESESFLKAALLESKETTKPYVLEAEFAKTKRNKSYIVVVVTAATIVVLALASYLVTQEIERSVAAAPVDVAPLEDLNLKDILDSSKRNESDLQRAKADLAQLQVDLRSSLAAVDRDYSVSAQTIQARNLPKAEETKALAAAIAARDAEKSRLNSDYASQAAKKRAEIVEIQKRVDQYDSRSLAKAKQEETRLSNERIAFDIEKQEMAKDYESRIAELERARKRDVANLTKQRDDLAASLTSRYNPTFSDDRASSLLSGWNGSTASPAPVPSTPYLERTGVLEAGASKVLDKSYENLEYLYGRLSAVPYINSVPPALSRIEGEARSSIASYRAALQSAGQGLRSRDDKIAELEAKAKAAEDSLARYRAAISAYALDSREQGYVLDAGDPGYIYVCLAPGVTVAEGSSGYVVRGDALIAQVTLSPTRDGAVAKVIKIESGDAIRPFDSIIVKNERDPNPAQ